MDSLSSSTIELLQYLLPGFLCAWIFHALTSHPLPSQFDRVLRALVFTVVIQFMLQIVQKWTLPKETTPDTNLVLSVLCSVFLGLFLAAMSNNDWLHTVLRFFKITRETSYSSEWFGVLYHQENYLVLHFTDGRRLMGWATEWPSSPTCGHFYMQECAWLPKSAAEQEIILETVEGMLIQASSVEMIEVLKQPQNIPEGDT